MDDLGHLLDGLRQQQGPRDALALPDGTVLRWGPLRALVAACGTDLDAAAPSDRSRVLIASSDPLRTVAAVLACLWTGRTAAVIDAGVPPPVALECARVVNPRIAWLNDAHVPVHAWPPGIDARLIPRLSVTGRLRALASSPLPAPVTCEPTTDAVVMLTSGSSGRPKGVRLSRRAIACHLRTLWKAWSGERPVRMASFLPLHHVDGLFQGALLPLISGGTAWLSGGDPRVTLSLQDLGEAVHRHALTHALITPTLARFFGLRAQGNSDDLRAPAFQFAISTAAQLPEDVWSAFQSIFGVPLANVYGLSETVAGSCFAVPATDSHRLGTVGKPIDCTVRAVDERGREVDAGETGELQIRGDHLFSGYIGDVAGGLAVEDGWLHTGDLGSIDEEGFVRVHGRLAASFKTGGLLVNPDSTTAVLRQEPEVLDAASTALPDPLLGSVLASAVVLKPGVMLAPAVLMARIGSKLPAAQRPRHLRIVDELPLGASGKPRHEQLLALFATDASRAAGAAEETWALVRSVAAEALGVPVEQLGPDDTPETVRGWDSFGHLAFVTGLETRLDRTLTLDEIQGLKSLGDAVRLLEAERS